MKRSVLAVLIVLCFVPSIVSAQDAEDIKCDSQEVTAAIASASDLLQQAQASVDAGDVSSAISLLVDANKEITDATSRCQGWFAEGTGTDVLGPLTLDGGVYILEYTGTVPSGVLQMGLLTISFENLEEEELIFDSVMEMRTEAGDFNGRQSVRLDGGRYLISIEATYLEGWTLALSKP